ncbi:hypothetical protein NG2371_05025 [Nocardia gamkensis]|nr:hypothetical protein [Nocardia gamkensis]
MSLAIEHAKAEQQHAIDADAPLFVAGVSRCRQDACDRLPPSATSGGCTPQWTSPGVVHAHRSRPDEGPVHHRGPPGNGPVSPLHWHHRDAAIVIGCALPGRVANRQEAGPACTRRSGLSYFKVRRCGVQRVAIVGDYSSLTSHRLAGRLPSPPPSSGGRQQESNPRTRCLDEPEGDELAQKQANSQVARWQAAQKDGGTTRLITDNRLRSPNAHLETAGHPRSHLRHAPPWAHRRWDQKPVRTGGRGIVRSNRNPR